MDAVLFKDATALSYMRPWGSPSEYYGASRDEAQVGALRWTRYLMTYRNGYPGVGYCIMSVSLGAREGFKSEEAGPG